jgi:hypothetical protein
VSYNAIAAAAQDTDLKQRVAACFAQETMRLARSLLRVSKVPGSPTTAIVPVREIALAIVTGLLLLDTAASCGG